VEQPPSTAYHQRKKNARWGKKQKAGFGKVFVRTRGKVQKSQRRVLEWFFVKQGQGSKEGFLAGKNSKDKRQVFEWFFV